MDEPDHEFADLLRRARSGDSKAMGELVREYESEVRAVARLRLGPALRPYLDSVDLVQSVHRSLLVGLRNDRFEFSKPADLIALALTIVRRKAARHWQKMRRQLRESRGKGSSAESREGLSETLISLSADDRDPASLASYKESLEKICSQLDASERQLLDLHLQGYRTAEAARLLNRNADVLRVKMSRLRAKLRAAGFTSDLI